MRTITALGLSALASGLALVSGLTLDSGTATVHAQNVKQAQDSQPTEKAPAQDLTKLSPEQRQIRDNAQAFVEAFNKADAKAVASLYAKNAQLSLDGQLVAEGRDAIEKTYADFFKENPSRRISVTIDSIKLMGPTLAIEKGTSQTDADVDSVDGYSMVHVKQEGKWLTLTADIVQRPVAPAFDWKQELEFFPGKWVAEKGDWRVDTTIEWVAGGNFLKRTFEVRNAGKQESSGVQIIGWDPIDGVVTSWTFSSEGGHGRGWWRRDGDHWVVESEATTADGEIVQSTNVFTMLGKDEFRWQSTKRSMNGVALEDTSSIRVRRVKQEG